MDPVFTVPGFPHIQWICQSPWTLCSQFQGFHRSSGFASIHGPCVHSSRVFLRSSGFASIHGPCVSSSMVSTDQTDLPVSTDPVFTVSGFSSDPTDLPQYPWTLCSQIQVSTDPVDLPVSMDPLLAVPVFPQIQQICQSPWTLCSQFQGCHQFQQWMPTSTTLVLLVPGVFTDPAHLHGSCVHCSRVSSDPVDLPVSMDPVFTVPGFPQIQRICQSPWSQGARCSYEVRAFTHGAIGHRIDPSWWTH